MTSATKHSIWTKTEAFAADLRLNRFEDFTLGFLVMVKTAGRATKTADACAYFWTLEDARTWAESTYPLDQPGSQLAFLVDLSS